MPGSNNVYLQNIAFSPATITVAVNTTVIWTNKDGVSHTVTSDNSSFDSGIIANNGTFSHQFTIAGTFPYHCKIHSMMIGGVIVK
jgi:plastocyanin